MMLPVHWREAICSYGGFMLVFKMFGSFYLLFVSMVITTDILQRQKMTAQILHS